MARITMLGIVALAVLAMAGCGSVGSSGSQGGKKTIAWIQIGANNPFWADENTGAAEAARRNGFSFKALSGNNDPATQADEVKQLVNQHVSAILLTALDIHAMTPALLYAKAHHVPVASLYSTSNIANLNSGFNEYQVGHDVGTYAIKMLTQRYGEPQGDVAVLQGALGQTLNAQRSGGFTDVMHKYPNVKVVATQPTDWLADKASSTMQDWLVKYPNLPMVYGLSDTITVPAIQVAARANKVCNVLHKSWKQNPNCTEFSSVDGDPIGITAIQNGQLGVTDLYAPVWAGYQFAMMGEKLATGQNPPSRMLSAYLVTPQNVACIARMQNDMTNKIKSFPFDGSLQQIAATFGCKPAA
jgi:ABC-type sugar transport system substrate-binding protein